MKLKILPLLILLLIAQSSWSQSAKYVCTPCGYDCDKESYDKGGICSHCGMALVKQSTITFKTVDLAGLCKRMSSNKQLVLLDVRSPEEFNNTLTDKESFGRFKNAININITELESRNAELNKYKNQEIMVYCSHSHRSPQASYYLSTHGFTNVTNVSGGVSTLADDKALGCLRDRYIQFPVKVVK